MNKAKSCAGTVLVDRHLGPPVYEIVSVHFPDGGAAVTIGDILARLAIAVKDRDKVKITVNRLPDRPRKRK
jgi:hypothetical protein